MLLLLKKEKIVRRICAFLAISIFFEIASPTVALALTSGPAQEEFTSFEPSSTTDMVDLYTGDFNYNIPLMSVPGPNGGYPINLAYHSGIGMEQEASWVGLGWTLNVGAINRQLRGLPDDFNGEIIKKRQYMKDNWMVALDVPTKSYREASGIPTSSAWNDHFQVYYNNFKGLGYKYSMKFSFPNKGQDETGPIGLNVAFDSQNGMDVEPKLSLSHSFGKTGLNAGFEVGLSYNSRQGLQKFNFSTSLGYSKNVTVKRNKRDGSGFITSSTKANLSYGGSSSSNISYGTTFNVPSVSIPMKSTTVPFNLKIAKPTDMGTPYNFRAKFPLLWSGYVNTSKLENEGKSQVAGYGYIFNNAQSSDAVMRDFQREEIPYSKKVPNLPTSGFTYDIFSQTGQGTGSMFRSYQNQISVLRDAEVINQEESYDGELEFGVGTGTVTGNSANMHVGLAFNYGSGQNRTGSWTKIKNKADEGSTITALKGGGSSTDPRFERTYFKSHGEKSGFYSKSSSEDQLNTYANDEAIRLEIVKEKSDKNFLNRHFIVNDNLVSTEGGSSKGNLGNMTEKNSTSRTRRATDIEYFSRAEALLYGYSKGLTYKQGSNPAVSKFSITRGSDHISEISMLQPDGMRYVYGLPSYNNLQVDNVFSHKSTGSPDFNTNTVPINASSSGIEGIDIKGSYEEFMSRSEIPAYPNSWLLTYIFSADYVDLTNDGPTIDDYGYWIKFNYEKVHDNYRWRAPYADANFIEGYKGQTYDDKASYAYGKKEIFFITDIETKTHVAKFITSDRRDAYDADSELQGGLGSTSVTLKKLDKIILYAKKDLIVNPLNPTPVKAVNFVYSYDLCQNIPNNKKTGTFSTDLTNPSYDENGNPLSATITNNGGKLTLNQIYFTYQNSSRSQLSPYIFKYASGTNGNPDYERRNMDRWGNYNNNLTKYASGNTYPYIDHPYTPQDPEYYTGATPIVPGQWSLNQIILPTGGTMNIDYDFDDYYYEEGEKACRMYDITGLGSSNVKSLRNTSAQTGNMEDKFIYIKLEKPFVGMATQADADNKLRSEYLSKLPKGQVYFKVYAKIKGKTSLTPTYDYVSGYADIDISNSTAVPATSPSGTYDYAKIALQKVPLSKVNVSGTLISPITRAIIEHLRVNRSEVLHNAVPYSTSPFAQIANILSSTFAALGDVTSAVTGFNNWVYNSVYNKTFDVQLNGYSMIRLCDPDNKIGGGIRVKKLTLNDNWTNGSTTDNSLYGQSYDYTTTAADGTTTISSGVAYEPQVGSEESALRTAVRYTNSSPLTSDYHTFVETPIARIHYPGESVGYSKVTVRSIGTSEALAATGNVINNSAAPITQYEFYTPKDFPVILKQTDMGPYSKPIFIPIPVLGLFTQSKRRQAKSQGYTVILNDMAGKPKANTVFTAKNTLVSSVLTSVPDKIVSQQKFIYNTVDPYNPNAKNELINKVQTISVDGSYNTVYRTAIIGQSHDMYVDMKENSQEHEAFGVMTNLDMAFYTGPPYCIPALWIMPSYNTTTNNMRTVVFNKIIHRAGILMKTETTTDKSTIVSENLAFDIETGKSLLTKVTNEFKDPIYSFSFPGHWYYSNIGAASKNFKVELNFPLTGPGLQMSDVTNGRIPITNAKDYFTKGDWVYIDAVVGTTNDGMYHVFTLDNSYIHCVNANGNYFPANTAVGSVKVVKSGYKNQQDVSVGSLAFMRFKNANPAGGYTPDFIPFDPKISSTEFTSSQSITLDDPNENNILNASAVQLSDDWQTSCGNTYLTSGTPTVVCTPSLSILADFMTYLKNRATASQLTGQNITAVVNSVPFVGTPGPIPISVTFPDPVFSTVYNNYPALQVLINSTSLGSPPYTSTGKDIYYQGFISPVTKNLIITFSDQAWPIFSDINNLCANWPSNMPPPYAYQIGFTTFVFPSSLPSSVNALSFWTAFVNSAVSTITPITPEPAPICTHKQNSWTLGSTVSGYGSVSVDLKCMWPCSTIAPNSYLSIYPCVTCLDISPCTTSVIATTTTCGTNPNNATVVNPYQKGMKGIWRPKYSYAYKTDRKQNDNARIDGTFNAFNRFPWENPATKDPKWIKSNTVSKYNPEGFEIENVNPIGNFSSALYGYDNALSTAVANNARYNDIGFDGFEDYPKTCDQDHFSYSNFSANVTNAQAHTGKYSIEVFNGAPANVSREVFLNCDANTVNGTPYVNDNPAPTSLNTFGGNYVSHVIKPCDCIGKFAPQIGKRYLVSAWVKEYLTSNPNNLIASAYTSSRIHITYYNGTTSIGNTFVYPQGNIIDGWQRLMGEYVIPSGCTSVSVDLDYFSSQPNMKVYFDDVRVQPTDANMKAFVYDNITLKVMAELDENNFATIYNYDEEGHLTKVKRETAEGIKTVQEGRINSKKVKN